MFSLAGKHLPQPLDSRYDVDVKDALLFLLFVFSRVNREKFSVFCFLGLGWGFESQVTPPYNGIIENEFCPVYVAFTDEDPTSNPEEVENYMWVDWQAYTDLLRRDPDKISYWAKDQYTYLKDLDPSFPYLYKRRSE